MLLLADAEHQGRAMYTAEHVPLKQKAQAPKHALFADSSTARREGAAETLSQLFIVRHEISYFRPT